MNLVHTLTLVVFFSFSAVLMAAEKMDHSQHSQQGKAESGYQPEQKQGGLNSLSRIPESGRSREAGFDKRYAMEPTTAHEGLAELCAKGTRGLIMLDRATWIKCGGIPAGLPAKYDNKPQSPHAGH